MYKYVILVLVGIIILGVMIPLVDALVQEPITIKHASLVDSLGLRSNFAQLGQNSTIHSVLVNNLNITQDYRQIVLIQDSAEITVFLSVTSGKLAALSTEEVSSEPWFLEKPEMHKVKIFVWYSKEPIPLAYKIKSFVVNFNP
ncbi:MAG: hypothetical protein QXU32_11850 [Nitrososphaerales archaeon]